jgi:hypothetical protein
MDKHEQVSFVRNLVDEIQEKLMIDIIAGRIPSDWDGIELRRLLASRFQGGANRFVLTGKRLRKYNNDVIVNDL